MARAKKPEDKQEKEKTLSIDVDSFVKTRDSVVDGLATLQNAIQTLSTAYIKHTNAVLGEHGQGLDLDSVAAKLNENPLFKLGEQSNRAPSPAKSVAADAPADKKERKKRQHDPNAPKRPLTPFFLYMQTARPIIAADLGAEVPKGAVSLEGTRRWGAMALDDKQLWGHAYKDNLRLYQARMQAYKAGNKDAKDMTDEEAALYADDNNISIDNGADAQLVGESSAAALVEEDPDTPEKEPTPPPKTPKAKATRKSRGSAKETPAAAAPETIVPPSSASIVPPSSKAVEKEKSPEKKRKRSGKKADEPVSTIEKEEAVVETPKSAPKPRKKKAKNDS